MNYDKAWRQERARELLVEAEEAKSLLDEGTLNQKQLAQKLETDQADLSNRLRLLQLPGDLKKQFLGGKLGMIAVLHEKAVREGKTRQRGQRKVKKTPKLAKLVRKNKALLGSINRILASLKKDKVVIQSRINTVQARVNRFSVTIEKLETFVVKFSKAYPSVAVLEVATENDAKSMVQRSRVPKPRKARRGQVETTSEEPLEAVDELDADEPTEVELTESQLEAMDVVGNDIEDPIFEPPPRFNTPAEKLLGFRLRAAKKPQNERDAGWKATRGGRTKSVLVPKPYIPIGSVAVNLPVSEPILENPVIPEYDIASLTDEELGKAHSFLYWMFQFRGSSRFPVCRLELNFLSQVTQTPMSGVQEEALKACRILKAIWVANVESRNADLNRLVETFRLSSLAKTFADFFAPIDRREDREKYVVWNGFTP